MCALPSKEKVFLRLLYSHHHLWQFHPCLFNENTIYPVWGNSNNINGFSVFIVNGMFRAWVECMCSVIDIAKSTPYLKLSFIYLSFPCESHSEILQTTLVDLGLPYECFLQWWPFLSIFRRTHFADLFFTL